MGSQIAKAAHKAGLGGEISDRARLVLNHMCWMARDTPSIDQPAAEYWEGHVALGMHLFGLNGSSKSSQELIRRCIKELIDAGLIDRVRGGQGNKLAKYRVLIGGRWAPAKAVDNSRQDELL